MIVVFEKRRDAQQHTALNGEKRQHYLVDHPLVAVRGLLQNYNLSADALEGLPRVRPCTRDWAACVVVELVYFVLRGRGRGIPSRLGAAH